MAPYRIRSESEKTDRVHLRTTRTKISENKTTLTYFQMYERFGFRQKEAVLFVPSQIRNTRRVKEYISSEFTTIPITIQQYETWLRSTNNSFGRLHTYDVHVGEI